jgi:hypothetical protein
VLGSVTGFAGFDPDEKWEHREEGGSEPVRCEVVLRDLGGSVVAKVVCVLWGG